MIVKNLTGEGCRQIVGIGYFLLVAGVAKLSHFFAEWRVMAPARVYDDDFAGSLCVCIDEVCQQINVFALVQHITADNHIEFTQ